MLYDLRMEIFRIVNMVADNCNRTLVDDAVDRLVKEYETIIKKRMVVNAIQLCFEIYSNDLVSLKRDIVKYAFFKDSDISAVKKDISTNLSVLFRISDVLDKLFDGDYKPLYDEIETREAEALLSESKEF